MKEKPINENAEQVPEANGPDSRRDARRALEEIRAFQLFLAQQTPRIYVTKIILLINAVIFAGMALTGASIFMPSIDDAIRWGACFGPLTLDKEFWRLFTSMFVHFGIIHFGFNMWFLWIFGSMAERLLGNVDFILLYVVSGLCGSVVGVWWHPEAVGAGASGALFGIVGGVITYLFFGKIAVPDVLKKRELRNLLLLVAFNLILGFTIKVISNAAHIGGLVMGGILGMLFRRSAPAAYAFSKRTRYVTVCLIIVVLAAATFAARTRLGGPASRFFSSIELIRGDRFDEAIKELNAILEENPEQTGVNYYLGLALHAKERYREAIEAYLKALPEMEKDVTIHVYLGVAYIKVEQLDQAEASFRRALAIDPDYGLAYANLGWIYYLRGNYRQCILFSERAIALDPEASPARYNIAICYLRLGEIEKAEQLYAEAIQSDRSINSAINQGALEDLKELIAEGVRADDARRILRELFELRDEDIP